MNLEKTHMGTENIQYHDKLCPVAWKDWDMRPEVRGKLLKIAKVFVSYLDIPDFKVIDVRLTGSLANFNWTSFSDFDLHVVTNYADLACEDLADALYQAKKTIWNDRHDITIGGHDVELYVEDFAKPAVSSGLFSVMKNRWLDKPEYLEPNYDSRAVNRKVQVMIDLIQKTEFKSDEPKDFERVINKIKKMRQSGLESAGEFSTENLAFKVLRNLGWIERLHSAYNQLVDKKLSLK